MLDRVKRVFKNGEGSPNNTLDRAAPQDEKEPKKKKEEWSRQTGCPTWNFSLVVVQHPDGRFLAVHESRGRGWWLPAGFVDPGDDLMSAAIRETKEEAGIDVRLEGILRIEHTMTLYRGRCRIVFFARPIDENQPPKSEPDKESEGAAWVTLDELVQLGQSAPGLRGPELLDWGRYVQGGGAIFPLTLLTREGEMIPPPPTSSTTTTSLASAPTATAPLPSSADTASSFSSSSSLVHARVAAEHEAGGSGIGIDGGGGGADGAQPLEDLTTSVTGITPRREATLVLTEERGSS
jgi:8-oxo-dGTP pyrophosphatase MutT (NUDIX family)